MKFEFTCMLNCQIFQFSLTDICPCQPLPNKTRTYAILRTLRASGASVALAPRQRADEDLSFNRAVYMYVAAYVIRSSGAVV